MGATLQLQNDPFAFDKDANNQPEYAAEEFRSNMGALVAESYADQLTARSGVCGDRHYKITLSGTNVVAAGGQAIKGQNTGPVFFSNNGNVTVGALSPADPTNPRKDRVVLYQSGGHQIIEVIDGTAAASPSAPAVPSGALDLATITVPVSGTPTVTDNRVYTTALGGVQYVATTAEVATAIPIGGLAYDAQDGKIKLRKSSGIVELREHTEVSATSGVATAASGWSITTQQFTKMNGVVYGHVDGTRTGADINGNLSGNIGNVIICTIAAAWRPKYDAPISAGMSGSSWTGGISPAGNVQLAAGPGNTTVALIAKNDDFSFNFSYLAATY